MTNEHDDSRSRWDERFAAVVDLAQPLRAAVDRWLAETDDRELAQHVSRVRDARNPWSVVLNAAVISLFGHGAAACRADIRAAWRNADLRLRTFAVDCALAAVSSLFSGIDAVDYQLRHGDVITARRILTHVAERRATLYAFAVLNVRKPGAITTIGLRVCGADDHATELCVEHDLHPSATLLLRRARAVCGMHWFTDCEEQAR